MKCRIFILLSKPASKLYCSIERQGISTLFGKDPERKTITHSVRSLLLLQPNMKLALLSMLMEGKSDLSDRKLGGEKKKKNHISGLL